MYIYAYIYEDKTLISLDQQAGGKIKQHGPGGHEGPAHEGPAHKGGPGRPIRAQLIRAQGGP